MADNGIITSLGFEAVANTKEAEKRLDSLIKKFEKLQNVTQAKISLPSANAIDKLSKSLQNFSQITTKSPVTKTFVQRMESLGTAIKNIDVVKLERISRAMVKLAQANGIAPNVKIPKAVVNNQSATLQKNALPNTNAQAKSGSGSATPPANASASVESFAEKWWKVYSAVDAVVGKIAKGIGGIAARGLASAGKAVLNFGLSPFKRIGNAIASATKRLGGFLSALKRIALYRAIRAVLKEITQAFKEGMQNLYQYSVLIDTQFSKSMDMLATSALYAKNSLGAMVEPIVNALAPAVDMLVDKFVALINTFNELIASFTGASTWTRALKYPTSYANELDKASGSAKELRKTLLGFDEINRLDDNTKGSRGSGADNLDYSKMFTEEVVTKQTEGWVQKIKDAFKNADFTEIGDAIGNSLKKGLDKINWTSIKQKSANVAKSFSTLINGFVDVDGLGNTIGGSIAEAINTGVNNIYTFFSTTDWNKVGEFIGDGINGFVKDFDAKRLGLAFATTINAGIKAFGGFVSTVDFKSLGEKCGESLSTAIRNLNTSGLASALSDFISGAANFVSSFLSSTDFEALGEKIAQFIAGVKWWKLFKDVTTAIWEALKGAIKAVGSAITSDPAAFAELATVIASVLAIKLTASAVISTISAAISSAVASATATVTATSVAAAATAGGAAVASKTIGGVIGGVASTVLGAIGIGKTIESVEEQLSTTGKASVGQTARDVLGISNKEIVGKEPSSNAINAMNNLDKLKNATKMYASGGTPQTGSLFLANEGGIPELVAQVGNKTQVANNDQITESIKLATMAGNSESNSLLREAINVLRGILDKDTTVVAEISTDSITEGLNRQNRRNGRTTIPIGG